MYNSTIPDFTELKCEIETPQFHGSADKFHMQKQKGTFLKLTNRFIPESSEFGHWVQFKSIEDFKKALIRLL